MRFANLIRIIPVFIILGMVGHEVIPHHHHNNHSEKVIHSCCNTDNENESKNHEPTCSLFDFVPLHSVKQGAIDFYPANITFSFFLLVNNQINFANQFLWRNVEFQYRFILKKPSLILYPYSHRGPPVL